jgi:hypothetical protein
MKDNPFSLWAHLSQSPLLWLTVTLLVYAIADAVSLATHRHPLPTRCCMRCGSSAHSCS